MKTGEPEDDLILAAIERERRRIGALLHESLCQTLGGISIQLDVLSRRLQGGTAVSLEDMTLLADHLDKAIAATRSIAAEVRSLKLEGAGLLEALGQLVDAASAKVPSDYVCEKPVFLSDANVGLQLFRIAEEALANACQHADAKRVTVSLDQTEAAVTLKVRDDGKGFVPAEFSGRINGIDLMRRRARSIGAKLEIESRPGQGTVVSCSVTVGE